MSTAILAIACVLAASPWAPGQSDLDPAVAATVDAELIRLQTILNDPSSSATDREEAARRLVDRGTFRSRAILDGVLADAGNPRGQLAVAWAVADDLSPDPALIDRLGRLLGADRLMTEAATAALANYKGNPRVIEVITNFIRNTPGIADPRQRDTARATAAAGLGYLAEKQSAATLIGLLVDENENPAVRNAAADGLIYITGRRDLGRDPIRWQAWWAEQEPRPDSDFRALALAIKAARADHLQRRRQGLADELWAIVSEQHRNAPPDRRAEQLARNLASGVPELRIIAARLIQQDKLDAIPPSAQSIERLRQLVGDSDSDVRYQVAVTLQAINDAGALDALLTQIVQETSQSARAAQASAIGVTGDPRGVRPLVPLLDDSSERVALAAAEAIRQCSSRLQQDDPQLAGLVAQRLRSALEGRTARAGAEDLRAAVVGAMEPLREPTLLQPLLRLLAPREATRVRIAALRALGTLGDPNAADAVAAWLANEPDPRGRLEAVRALGRTGSFDFATTLYDRMNPAAEPDALVREEAWRQFQSLLPTAPLTQLTYWPDRFNAGENSLPRRLSVLEAIAQRLIETRDLETLAITRQRIGETWMGLSRPDEAARYFRLSLDYFRGIRANNMTTERLIEQLAEAMLDSNQFDALAEFASAEIARDPGAQQTFGPRIRSRIVALQRESKFADAVTLLNSTAKMKTPLTGKYLADLAELRPSIEQGLANQNRERPSGNASTRGPIEPGALRRVPAA